MKTTPYWWDDVTMFSGQSFDAVPEQVDILVIGSGYTGCSAAMTIAQQGRKPVVIDAGKIGEGASSRNGGQVRGGVKRRYKSLVTAFGDEKARLIASETEAAFDFFEERVATLNLRTDYVRCGTFVGAHSKAAFDTLKRTADDATGDLADNYEIIEKADIDREIQTDIYNGGMVIKRAGGVQPARYHTALATACESAGAALFEYTRATQIVQKADKSFSVTIASTTGAQQDRTINANEIIVATNGYSTKLTPWLASRVIPVKSFIIATQPVGNNMVRDLIPNQRMISDTKRVLYYYRPSPDGERILFGGRASFGDPPLEQSGTMLRRFMVDVFPGLADVEVTHSWSGYVAFSGDFLPHFGQFNGIYYAAPYNGSGVAMSTYMGHRLALRLLGMSEPGDSMDAIAHHKPFPGYGGNPWFLPIVGQYYKMRDWLDKRS